nr:MAG TPA_asm: hypothetical protein [Caudoviricetes sp.]
MRPSSSESQARFCAASYWFGFSASAAEIASLMVMLSPPVDKKRRSRAAPPPWSLLRQQLCHLLVERRLRLLRPADLRRNVRRHLRALAAREQVVYAVDGDEQVWLLVDIALGDKNLHKVVFLACHGSSLWRGGFPRPLSVCRVGRAVAGAAHHAQHALGVEDGRAVGLELVADGAELVQRTARLRLVLDDHLQRAAVGIDDAEGVLAEEIGRVGHAAVLVFVAVAAEDRREGVADEAHAVQLADLAVVDLLGRGVLVRLDPLVGAAQVVDHRGMHDCNVLAAYGRHTVLLELGHRLVDHVRRQQAPAVRRRGAAGTGSLAARAHRRAGGRRREDLAALLVDVVAVEHVGVGQQRIADEHLLGLRCGRAHFLRRAEDHVVIGVQLKLIGDGGVGAVLVDGAGLGAHAELLAGGDDGLLQLGGACEGVPLAPFHGLAVVPGQRLLFAELRVVHLRAGILQQLGVVKRLELAGERVVCVKCRLGAGVGVDVGIGCVDQRAAAVGEELDKRELIFVHGGSSFRGEAPGLLAGIELLVAGGSLPDALLECLPFRLARFSVVECTHGGSARTGLAGPRAARLDGIGDLFGGLPRADAHGRLLELLAVYGIVGVLDADAAARRCHPGKDGVLELPAEVEAGEGRLQRLALLLQALEVRRKALFLLAALLLLAEPFRLLLHLHDALRGVHADTHLHGAILVKGIVVDDLLRECVVVDVVRVQPVLPGQQRKRLSQLVHGLDLGLVRPQPSLYHLLHLLVVFGVCADLLPAHAGLLRGAFLISRGVRLRFGRGLRLLGLRAYGALRQRCLRLLRPSAELVCRNAQFQQPRLPGVGSLRFARGRRSSFSAVGEELEQPPVFQVHIMPPSVV